MRRNLWLRSFHWRKIVAFLSLTVLTGVIFTITRSQMLLSNGRKIGEQSAAFKRDYFVGSTKAPPLTYLAMGDSTAAGWGGGTLQGTYPYQVAELAAAQGHRVHVVNVAVGGATIHDLCQKQLTSLQTVHPDLVTVSIGANDATHGTSGADYRRDYQTMIGALQKSGARRILVANTPDMYQPPALPWLMCVMNNRRALRLNQIQSELVRGTQLKIVDLYNQGKLEYHRDHALYAADLFHPSAKGYAIWAKVFGEELGNL